MKSGTAALRSGSALLRRASAWLRTLLDESPIEVRRHAALGIVLPALFVPTVGGRDVAAPAPSEPPFVVASMVDASVRALGSVVPEVAPPFAHVEDLAALPAPTVRRSDGPIEAVILKKQTLAGSLAARGVGARTLRFLQTELASVFDFRRARPGDHYSLRLGRDGSVEHFEYRAGKSEVYKLYRQGGRLVAERKGGEFVRRTARIAGVVTTTLYEAIDDLGESPQLAKDFAEIFAYDVDFARGLQRGDEFQILYERLFKTDARGRERYVGPGRIHAAHFEGRSEQHTAVYFQDDAGHGAYYRPDGSPVQKSFVIAPVKYERMTSGYTIARFHPILGVTRPHLGIDYAAPHGTPLWSVGDGKVVFMGRFGGFGNLIKVQHPNGYISYYSHLSRFASGLSVGDTVRQKQVIGYVGQSGLATGPHVCFRVQKPTGEYVNPAQISHQMLDRASVAKRQDFRAARDTLIAGLRSSELLAVDEAL
jgi:murein DD-endopeptidase MepM/ murein hydrolase activator NlpD